MSNSDPKSRPFSIRLTPDERAELERRAGTTPLGTFAKGVLFGQGTRTERARTPKAVTGDHQALGRLLAALGASRLASNFNQIAKAANQGALPVTKELEDELWAACAQITDMRRDLLGALGIKATSLADHSGDAARTFNEAAGAQR